MKFEQLKIAHLVADDKEMENSHSQFRWNLSKMDFINQSLKEDAQVIRVSGAVAP